MGCDDGDIVFENLISVPLFSVTKERTKSVQEISALVYLHPVELEHCINLCWINCLKCMLDSCILKAELHSKIEFTFWPPVAFVLHIYTPVFKDEPSTAYNHHKGPSLTNFNCLH